ncbi:MAG: ATP-binding cassette domain-containing protein, partial [Parabacteroides sp.]|nr:ATP-binding cassette domain-containing protein [Parabacteroides sp.]
MKTALKNIRCQIRYRKYLERQQESSDCGIACLNSILKHYKLTTSLEHLRNISGTTRYGTSVLGLCQAAGSFGITMTAFRFEPAQIEKVEVFDILLVPARNRDNHYILILENANDYVVVMDPLLGIVLYKNTELKQLWQTGIVLKIRQPENFPIEQKKENFSKHTWLNTLLKKRRLFFISSFILTLLVVVLNISTFLFLKILIDRSFTQHQTKEVFFICGIMLFALLLKSILTYFKAKVNNIVLNDIHIDITYYFTRLFFRLPKSFFASRKTGELVARYNDSAKIQDSLSYFLNESLQHLLIVILSLGFIFIFSWKIGVIIALFIPVLYAISILFWKNIIKLQMGVMSANVQKTGSFINIVQGIDYIKMAGKEHFFSRLNMTFFKNYQKNNFDKANLNASLFFTADIAIAFILFLILLMSSQAILDEQLLIGELIAIFSLFLSLTPSIISLPFTGLHLQNYKVAVNRINDLNYLCSPKNDTGIPFTNFSTVSFNQVDFSYPGCKKVIHELSFTIKKNEFVCFIGESGIGKTTLINLIIGFYQPTSGKILIDGKNMLSLRLR